MTCVQSIVKGSSFTVSSQVSLNILRRLLAHRIGIHVRKTPWLRSDFSQFILTSLYEPIPRSSYGSHRYGFRKTLKEHNFALFQSCLCPTPLYNSTRLHFNNDATDSAMVQVRPSFKLEMYIHHIPLISNTHECLQKVILWSASRFPEATEYHLFYC